MESMLSRLSELLKEDALARVQELQAAADEAQKPRKRKKRRSRKKKTSSRSPSPLKQPTAPQLDRPSVPTLAEALQAQHVRHFYSPTPLADQCLARRPVSAIVAGSSYSRPISASPALRPYLTRPVSAGPAFRPTSAAAVARPASPGPSKTEKTEPKYTATSLKKPELGTYPGAYRSPSWSPRIPPEVDPNRQELPQPIGMEGRFKHVLAVPAHVLAQSLYHPDNPTSQARARQLQEDLRTARLDRKLAVQEKAETDRMLKDTQEELAAAQAANAELAASNRLLQEQLSTLNKSVRGLAFDKEALGEQLKSRKDNSWEGEALRLRRELMASQQEVETLRLELQRALRLVVDR